MGNAMIDINEYGSTIASLIADERLADLGPGNPNSAVRSQLAALTPATAFGERKIADQAMTQACISGLWLYHDFLDESHTISQDIHTPEGSFWHAIMHRREPDAWNSKYWWRRVGNHPVFPSLRDAASEIAASFPDPAGAFLAKQSAWDPDRFVDLCTQFYRTGSPAEKFCKQIQFAEWQLLFNHCFEHAVAK